MTDLLTYKDSTELCLERMKSHKPKTGKAAETAELWDIDEEILTEGERLNALLPLIKWEIEHDMLTRELSDELYLYYEDYINGKLDDVIADYEKDEVIHDLTECFNKVFPDGLEN